MYIFVCLEEATCLINKENIRKSSDPIPYTALFLHPVLDTVVVGGDAAGPRDAEDVSRVFSYASSLAVNIVP